MTQVTGYKLNTLQTAFDRIRYEVEDLDGVRAMFDTMREAEMYVAFCREDDMQRGIYFF
jgi:hypothetical protein